MKRKDHIKISVIIPMYNGGKSIIQTLESIRNQTALNLIHEVIIVNDGSTDDSAEIVNNYIKKFKVMPIILINKQNGGASSARNLGMKESKGNFIALLDSDDVWLPNKIELQMKTFLELPEVDFIGGDYNGTQLKILFKKIDHLYKANIKDICLKSFPATPTVIFKKEIIDEIGYFDETQKYAEDTNYFMKICSRYNYYYLPEQLAICGNGKPTFGYSGLSSNLKEMHRGTIKNIRDLRDKSLISLKFYSFLRIFYWLKYIRRVVITKKRIFFNKQ